MYIRQIQLAAVRINSSGLFPRPIQNGDMHLAVFAVPPGFYLHLALAVVFDGLGRDHDAQPTQVIQVEVTFVDHN